MQKIQLKIKKLLPEAKLPAYGSANAAGADLYALSEHAIRIGANETAIVHTGLAAEIPEGYVGLIFARSGLATKKGLAPANKVGVIDSDYRGEIRVALHHAVCICGTDRNGRTFRHRARRRRIRFYGQQISEGEWRSLRKNFL